ncbi:hypothetical protein [Rhodoplanes serenus]|uniref:hypothetical protein n=1 Tax=Rhodoplanes serenus TaxID=200615 RepID=UPI0011B9466D|nr:hypothetical protein [Rhodoplanes serenus]
MAVERRRNWAVQTPPLSIGEPRGRRIDAARKLPCGASDTFVTSPISPVSFETPVSSVESVAVVSGFRPRASWYCIAIVIVTIFDTVIKSVTRPRENTDPAMRNSGFA